MKRELIISELLLIMFLFGCNNNQIEENQTTIYQDNNESITEEKSPFCQKVIDAIQECIYDSTERMQSAIYSIWFAKTDGDCCFAIDKAICYDTKLAEGFYLIDDKLIVYYGTNVTCGAIMEGRIDPFINRENKVKCDISCLIDTILLLKECPAGFPDENSDEALYTQVDPYGKIFKVHSCDSLELIYYGFL